MAELKPGNVHLVVTSPPYWTLKEYRKTDGQLGYVADYEEFLTELDKVWKQCFGALVPGGRVICVVGDVCLSPAAEQRASHRCAASRVDHRALPAHGVR